MHHYDSLLMYRSLVCTSALMGDETRRNSDADRVSVQDGHKALQEKEALQSKIPRLTKEVESLHAEYTEAKIEFAATIRLFEEQLGYSMEEAARLARMDGLIADTNANRMEACQRVRLLESENSKARADVVTAQRHAERAEKAHGTAITDLEARNSQIAYLTEQQQQLKQALEESERVRMDLSRDLCLAQLESSRLRDDKDGQSERVNEAATIETQQEDLLLQNSVLQSHLSANEDERTALEKECARLLGKEQELQVLTNKFDRLERVSWQLARALTAYRQQHVGVGMCVRVESNTIILKDLHKAGTASRSELRCGDVLLQINGRKLGGLSLERVQSLILGPAGTEVCITARSGRTGDKYNVTLLRGFEKSNAAQNVVEDVEEACSAAMQLQRDLASSKDCLDTVCRYHRQRYLEIARLVSSIVRLLTESGRDGIAFGRDGLAEILQCLDCVRTDVSTETHLIDNQDKTSEISSAQEGSMHLSVDPDVFRRALDAEQHECNGMLGALLKAVQDLLNKYQQHARNTSLVKSQEVHVSQLNASMQQLESELRQALAKKKEVQHQLEKCMMELRSAVGEKIQMDKVNLDLTRTSASSAGRVKDLEKERESLMAEINDVNQKYRGVTLQEQRLQAQCHSVQSQLSTVRDELSSVTGDLSRLISTVCISSTSIASVGMKVKSEDRNGMCTVISVTPGGAADCCGRISVGDTVLSVNGEAVQQMTTSEVQQLFHGTLGSEVCIVARKNQNASSEYSVDLVRSLPGVQQRKIPICEQTLEAIRAAEALHEQVRRHCSRRQQEAEQHQQLEEDHAALTQSLAALEVEIGALKATVSSSEETLERERCLARTVVKEREELRGQVAKLTKVLALRLLFAAAFSLLCIRN